MVSLVSFGYRYGVPADADLVFDVRFLPNPHFIPRLRKFSGQDAKVARYIRSFPQTGEFLRRIESLLTYLIPHYIREGKSYLTIAFGCTGGRHRSVMMAEAMRAALARARLHGQGRAPRPGQSGRLDLRRDGLRSMARRGRAGAERVSVQFRKSHLRASAAAALRAALSRAAGRRASRPWRWSAWPRA